MKIVVDCEFTQLNATSKLISMALVTEDAQELYFELIGNYELSDCSDFVLEHVVPQLDGGHVACTIHAAQEKLQAFLKRFEFVQIMMLRSGTGSFSVKLHTSIISGQEMF